MKISLLLASRERPEKLKRCIHSIINTVASNKNIEIIFGLDEDQIHEIDIYSKFALSNDIYIDSTKIMFKYGDYYLNEKYNKLAENASNEILLSIANDIEFTTNGWDEILINKFESLPKDKIGCFWFNDGIGSETLPRHYAIHQNYISVTGSYARFDLKHYFSDNWIYIVSQNLSALLQDNSRYGRLDIEVVHDSTYITGSEKDELCKKEELKWFKIDNLHFNNLLQIGFAAHEVIKLYEYIRSCK